MDDTGNTKKTKEAEVNKKKQKVQKEDPYYVMNREADTFFGGGSWPLPADELVDKK